MYDVMPQSTLTDSRRKTVLNRASSDTDSVNQSNVPPLGFLKYILDLSALQQRAAIAC